MPIQVPKPPPSLFQVNHRSYESIVSAEERQVFYLSHFSFPKEGGIWCHYIGKKFPSRGWVTLGAVTRINLYKRALMASLMPFSNKSFLVSLWPTILLPWKYKLSILQSFVDSQTRLGDTILLQDFYELKNYADPAKGIYQTLNSFLYNIGVQNFSVFSLIIAHLIEFDSAYHCRLQDIMSESKGENWTNPRKEISRLVSIFEERESRPELTKRIKQLATLTRFILLSKRFRIALTEAIQPNLALLQYVQADKYQLLTATGKKNGGYDWLGRTEEDRQKEYESHHTATVHEGTKTRKVQWYPPYQIISNLVHS